MRKMEHHLRLKIQSQPTDSTCGPTCLQAVYAYWNDEIDLAEVISDIGELPNGGTMAVQLACHALSRGYNATIYTYNLYLFDPTWFPADRSVLAEKLKEQCVRKQQTDSRLADATESYLKFLELGGELKMEPLEDELLVRYLLEHVPVLSGLSATFLYQEPRERGHPPNPQGKSSIADDVGGEPTGHFVVLSGYDSASRQVLVNDPLRKNPFSDKPCYAASLSKVAAAILLGIATYDSNLLMIQPMSIRKG